MSLKISIITVVYNNQKYISDCIESVVGQTYKNIEYIVVDGGSTDGTLKEIDKYKNRINILVSEKDAGIYDALNKGIKLATGDIIGILHSDDLFSADDILEKIAHCFENNDINVLYGDLLYIQKDQPQKIIRYWLSSSFQFSKLKKGWMPPHPTLFIKKELFDLVSSYQLQYKIAADYDFMLRLFSLKNIKPFYFPQIITKMRLGGASNKSIRNIVRKSYEDYLILKRNKIGGLAALFFKNISKIGQFIKKQK